MHSGQSIGKNHGKRGIKGYDGAKKVKGRKRHIITDTQGFVLGCYVGAASENDRDVVKMVFDNMKKMWADMGYQGKDLKTHIEKEYGINIEIVKRLPCRFWVHKDTPLELLPQRNPVFAVQPRRWLVERTFA